MDREMLRQRLAKMEGIKTGADLLRERAESSRREPSRLPGTEVTNELGRYQLVETRIGPDTLHGDNRIGAILEIDSRNVALAARMEGETLDFRRAVYLDTETTSLESGAGVHVFMIGTGHFDGGDFVVRQFFMRTPAEERAMLFDFGRFVSRFDTAVSFFGKNFDLPRITDRFNHNMMPLEFPPIHLDLCHVGRRIWRGRFGDCQLQTLERRALRFARRNDLPSAECPRAYFAYLAGLPSKINDVFEHNRLDVASMAVLTWLIDREMTQASDPIVKTNVAQVFEAGGRVDDAARLYEEARETLWPPEPQVRTAAVRLMKRLSMIHRRRGNWGNAAMLWQEMVDRSLGGVFAHERLAIYYEHVERDFSLGCEHARAALAIAADERASATARDSLRRRVERLEARLTSMPAKG